MSTTLTLSQIFGQMLLMVVPYRFLHQHVFVQVFFVLISILFAILLHMLPDTPVALLKRAEIMVSEWFYFCDLIQIKKCSNYLFIIF